MVSELEMLALNTPLPCLPRELLAGKPCSCSCSCSVPIHETCCDAQLPPATSGHPQHRDRVGWAPNRPMAGPGPRTTPRHTAGVAAPMAQLHSCALPRGSSDGSGRLLVGTEQCSILHALGHSPRFAGGVPRPIVGSLSRWEQAGIARSCSARGF